MVSTGHEFWVKNLLHARPLRKQHRYDQNGMLLYVLIFGKTQG